MTPTTQEAVADRLLSDAGAEPGDRVRVTTGDRSFEGVLMQRHAFSAPEILVLKLDSGYNLGLSLEEEDAVEVLGPGGGVEPTEPGLPEGVDDLPTVALLGTGGTIASFVEYRTGAVYPATSPEELAAAVPEAFEHANLKPKVVFEAFSEDLTPGHWARLADEIQTAFEDGAQAVVVTHGTDTMHFTAAALGILFDELPGPVALVGAQRSSDRPSSDAATNLVSAVHLAATSQAGEVVIVMHEGISDTGWSIHAAGRARKMHTSRRDAFQSIGAPPLGRVTPDGVSWDTVPRPPAEQVQRTGGFEEDVGLVWSYPTLTADQLRAAAGKGLVIAATGLGHINRTLIPTVQELVDDGVVVAVASQCLHGRTNLRVYETGRELLQAGAIEAGDMLPETAYVKLSWALGTAERPEEAKDLFLAPRGREASERSTFHYPSAERGER